MQVPGCTTNLLRERNYNRVRLICNEHLFSQVVQIDGRTMRYCQQCTR